MHSIRNIYETLDKNGQWAHNTNHGPDMNTRTNSGEANGLQQPTQQRPTTPPPPNQETTAEIEAEPETAQEQEEPPTQTTQETAPTPQKRTYNKNKHLEMVTEELN